MHPNLFENAPLNADEPTTRLNATQVIAVLGTWIALFAIGYVLLP